MRTDLLSSWRASLPADAPNHFLINVQPHEVAGIKTFLGERSLGHVELFPMVRGPVSYTHLDVYKRQLHDIANLA